jgi:DNA polymerase-3 subunit delta'
VAKKKTRKKAVTIEAPSVDLPAVPRVALDQVVGHDRAVEVLMGAIRSGRLHHAWLFQGPLGVGKLTTAVAFAGILLDPTSRPNMAGVIEPDAGSPTQRLLASGTHPDLHIVTKELARFSDDAQIRDRKLTNIPVEVVRERVLEPAAMSASIRADARAKKVIIIDEAELLAHEGQNILLKTLEEPPAGTVIILITSQAERLLPTIRSRCQRVTFGTLTDEEMRRWIEREAGREGSPIGSLGEGELADLLLIAEGSPGMALLAAETGMAAWPSIIEPKLADLDAGRPIPDLGRAMADLIGTWASDWVDHHDGASKEAANRAAARHMIRLLAAHYRRALQGGASDVASRAIETIAEVEPSTQMNIQAQFVFEDLAARLSMLRS